MYDIMTTLCVWYTYQHRFLNELSAATTRAPTILQLRKQKGYSNFKQNIKRNKWFLSISVFCFLPF